MSITGAQLLISCLRKLGVDRVFGVPGESYLAVLDALHDVADVPFITCRHESGAAFMAEADGKLTGRPGIAFVTRGPGATNASIAIHTAQQDSTPLILFVGQVASHMKSREAFQELDYRAVFGSMAKWVAEIEDAARIPEMLSRAFHTAQNGRPGPVVLALPEDMQNQVVEHLGELNPVRQSRPSASRAEVAEVILRMQKAQRPLIIVGGSGWSQDAADILAEFSTRTGLPVVTEFRCQDFVDNNAPCFVGDMGLGIAPYLANAIKESDVILALGARLGEVPTQGYSLLDIPVPRQHLIHIMPEPGELGRVYQPKCGILADPARFLEQISLAMDTKVMDRARAEELRSQWIKSRTFPPAPGDLDLAKVIEHINTSCGEQAIVTNGAGNYTVWVHKQFLYRQFRSQLAPVSGVMGYGVPAAVAAALRHPDRPVICFAGDGCFLMTGQELATAVRYKLKIIFIVVNNEMYGTIRMHQERTFPGRVTGTDLTNPDFAVYAKSFGADSFVVEKSSAFAEAFELARAADGPSVIELRVDPEALTPKQSLSAVREAALN